MSLMIHDVSVIDTPWERVRHTIPLPATVADIPTDDDEFAELLRSHLLPRETTPAYRARFTAFWGALRSNQALGERAWDLIEQMADTTDDAIAAGDLDEQALKRATRYLRHCETALNRLDRPERKHLEWAGNAGRFNPAAARVIDTLVTAIAAHRTTVEATGPTPADQKLWNVLRAINLDPRDYQLDAPPRQRPPAP